MTDSCIYIVTGSNLRSEEFDRPLAYYLRERLLERLGSDHARRVKVISDILYLNSSEIQRCACVTVGGPDVNAVTSLLFESIPYALAIDDVLVVQMDLLFQNQNIALWGMSPEATSDAVEIFMQDRYMGEFVKTMVHRDAA
jgi:hypothetical protein